MKTNNRLKKWGHILLLPTGAFIVSISVVGCIPIAIMTDYMPGLLLGFVGIIVGCSVSALAWKRLLH